MKGEEDVEECFCGAMEWSVFEDGIFRKIGHHRTVSCHTLGPWGYTGE